MIRKSQLDFTLVEDNFSFETFLGPVLLHVYCTSGSKFRISLDVEHYFNACNEGGGCWDWMGISCYPVFHVNQFCVNHTPLE